MKKVLLNTVVLIGLCGLLTSCGSSESTVEEKPKAKETDQPQANVEEPPAALETDQPQAEVVEPPEAELTELEKRATQTADEFAETDPKLERFFKDSKGYAVFPKISKGGFIVGGAHGEGVVFENATPGARIIGATTLTQGSRDSSLRRPACCAQRPDHPSAGVKSAEIGGLRTLQGQRLPGGR